MTKSGLLALLYVLCANIVGLASRIGTQQLRNYTMSSGLHQQLIGVSDTSELGALEREDTMSSNSEVSQDTMSSNSEVSQEQDPEHNPGSSGVGWEIGDIDVVVENLSGFKITKLIIIHKHLGMKPPTTVMEWNDLDNGALSGVRRFTTAVGRMAVRNDYWLATWTFEKQAEGCLPCEKVNRTCATWLSESDNALVSTMLDFKTYVKAAVTAASVAISAASAGTATAIAVTLGGMVTDSVANALLTEENVNGFASCGIKKSTLARSQQGEALKIVILPEHNEKRAILRPAKIVFKQFDDDADNCVIGVSPMKCEAEKQGEEVDIRIKAGPASVRTAALLHRYKGFTPSLDILHWNHLGANQISEVKATSTTTGMMKMYNDMWLLSWVEAGRECVVKSTMPYDLWQKLEDSPEWAAYEAATRLRNALIGLELSLLTKFAEHASSYRVNDPTMTAYGWSSDVEDIMGKEALFHLAGTQDVNGFKKCNLRIADLQASGPVDVILPESDDGDVMFKWHKSKCNAKVVKRCRPNVHCQRNPICEGL